MRTKETQEHQSDEINKLYEEVARKASEVRRASGLSHYEFAAKLGIPVWYSEILENGILISTDDKRYRRWSSCPFAKEDLLKISGQLSACIGFNPCARASALETVFFCPVTISHSGIMKELQSLSDCLDITSHLVKQTVGIFNLKYRLLCQQTCLKTGRRSAELMRQKLLSVLDARRIHL